MSLTPAEKLVDLIGNFIDYVYNNIETLYGAENENEHEPIVIPRQFYARGIGSFSCMIASNFNTYWWGYGGWSLLYEYDITCSDGNVNLSGWTKLGRYKKGTWDAIHPYSGGTPNADEGDNILTGYVEGHNYPEIIKKTYPTDPVSANYGLDSYNNPSVNFDQFIGGAWSGSGLYNTYQLYNALSENANPRIQYGDYRTTYSEDGVYVDTPYQDPFTCYANTLCVSYKDSMLVTQTNDDTYINKYITNNAAEHNYNYTYETENGDEITVYYGDNYVIYKCDDDTEITYDDNYNIINKIKDDTDIPIDNPTYHDKKYGPEPPEPELISDNQEDGGNYNHAEFTKVYACTSAELENLYQWMGGGAAGSSGTSPVTVPDSFDPMNRIVGLIGYPMVIDAGVGDETTFTFRNAANQTINTGWSTYKYANFDRAFDFGTVDIPNWEELANKAPFLDYSATVEIYIPFCGIVGLDPQAVMGCTLSCKMWIDFLTGDCSAVVYTNYGGEDAQHPVAFVSGNCGSAEVVSANAFGAYQGAKAQASHKMSQAILGGFKDLATSVIGGATTGFTRGAANPSGTGGNAGMRAGAIGSVIGGAMNLGVNLTLQNMDNRYAVQVAKNALGTTISGSFGQQTSWYYMDKPYIKVTWPTPISKDVELYGKTFGVPVHRSGALSEFTGYTVCNNVDVSGITGATASELAIIKQFLETGVFIKEGGEE